MGGDITVRHGNCIFYCKTPGQAAQMIAELGRATTQPRPGNLSTDSIQDLDCFAEEFRELEKSYGGKAALRKVLPPPLANEARGLLRTLSPQVAARGS